MPVSVSRRWTLEKDGLDIRAVEAAMAAMADGPAPSDHQLAELSRIAAEAGIAPVDHSWTKAVELSVYLASEPAPWYLDSVDDFPGLARSGEIERVHLARARRRCRGRRSPEEHRDRGPDGKRRTRECNRGCLGRHGWWSNRVRRRDWTAPGAYGCLVAAGGRETRTMASARSMGAREQGDRSSHRGNLQRCVERRRQRHLEARWLVALARGAAARPTARTRPIVCHVPPNRVRRRTVPNAG